MHVTIMSMIISDMNTFLTGCRMGLFQSMKITLEHNKKGLKRLAGKKKKAL